MNFYDFSGGIVNRKSPYLIKKDEALELCNFDVDKGGLTVRPGTVQKYGPFAGDVKSIHKALSTKGHEILFVQSEKYVNIVVGGVECNIGFHCQNLRILPVMDGFAFLIDSGPRLSRKVFRRVDGAIDIVGVWEAILLIERLPDDYSTLGEFPSDLYGKNIWDEETNTLYYAKKHTDATRENIGELIKTDSFVAIGKQGDLLFLQYTHTAEVQINLKTVYHDYQTYTYWTCNTGFDMFQRGISVDKTGVKACSCPYIVWHPASMRYFAAGHPDNPTALFISEPNDWYTYRPENVLYPHLHLGKITGLSVVEKSVVVSYEHGWSHYVGSDPTEDGQWSLLSVPDGARYGKTVCTTPGSVSFLSDSGLVSFSASMLTVQMLYSPSSSLYKFLSKEKIDLPIPKESAFSFYQNGIYYFVIDDTMYLYHFTTGAFLCYRGLTCQCMEESYNGEILMGSGKYVTVFSKSASTDYDPVTDSKIPISYSVKIPILGAVDSAELARSKEVAVVTKSLKYPLDCRIRLSSEREEKEGELSHTSHLRYGDVSWAHRYRDSSFSETILPWQVTGSLFFLEIFGNTNPEELQSFQIYHICLKLKKEREK